MDSPLKADLIRILLVDDHPVVRAGLAIMLGKVAGFSICGEAEGVRKAVSLIKSERPDLVLIDLDLENGSGLDVIRETLQEFPDLRILMFSMHDESLYAERALRAGARGYLMKNESPQNLFAAIKTILSGEIYISERMKSNTLKKMVGKLGPENDPLASLSDRELEVFRELGKGLGTRKIAEKLCLGIKTIETHMGNIKKKLQIKDSAELMHRAFDFSKNAGSSGSN